MVIQKQLEEEKTRVFPEKVKENGKIEYKKLKKLNKKIQRYSSFNSKRMPDRIREKVYELMKEFNERAEEVYEQI